MWSFFIFMKGGIMDKHKLNIKELTADEYYSLHDVSQELNVSKRDVMNYVRDIGMSVRLVFSKYTVFTKTQFRELKNHFKKGVMYDVTDSNKVEC